MSDPSRKHYSYEEALRGLGAYLDRCGGQDVELMEIPNGFVLRFRPETGAEHHALVQFDHADLRRLSEDQVSDRFTSAGDVEHYESFLCALGKGLDDTGARHILVEHVNQETMVRYTYVHDELHSLVEDRCALLGPDERRQLLLEAVS